MKRDRQLREYLGLALILIVSIALPFYLSDHSIPLEKAKNSNPTVNSSSRMPASVQSAGPITSGSTLASSASPTPTIHQDESGLKSFLQTHYPGQWTFQKTDSGRIVSIYGGMIPEVGKTSEEVVKFARTVAPFLGVNPNQLSALRSDPDSSPRTVSFDFSQNSQGFTVFDGHLRILSRKQDSAIYMVNSDLKTPDPVETEARYSVAEARAIVEERFSGKDAKIEQIGTVPVLWANEKPHELAWHFNVETNKPQPDRLEVLVGVNSGKILLERSTLLH